MPHSPMRDQVIDLGAELLPLAHALNERYATELSATSFAAFAELVGKCAYARAIGSLDGFLMAFDLAARIQGENIAWFRERFTGLLYVDRIAVHPDAQGRGVARRLYCDLFDWASPRGYTAIGCEVNVRPPNPKSAALHAALGFGGVGERELQNGKRVRYLVRPMV